MNVIVVSDVLRHFANAAKLPHKDVIHWAEVTIRWERIGLDLRAVAVVAK